MFEIFAGHRLLTEKTVRHPTSSLQTPGFFRDFQLVQGKKSDMAVSFFIVFSGLWVIFQEVLLGSFLVNLVLILLGCRI